MLLRRLRPAFGAAGSVTTFLLLSMLLAPAPAGASADVMPGDLVTVTTLSANFDGDNPNQPPNATLPGAPTGDYLTFDTSAGTISVAT